MVEQDQICATPAARTAALAGSGMRVGANYLAHYGKLALTGQADSQALDRRNANDVFNTFSKLKGGPLKLAQMLSIDRHLLPPAYAEAFSKAQYTAPPLSFPLVERTFRREFGCGPDELFDAFDRHAAHGASIGQVHRAKWIGRNLAVKIQYPGVAESLKSDLQTIKPIALRILGIRERDVTDYFEEVQTRLLEETNYRLELQRSMQLADASRHLNGIAFPEFFPDRCSSKILTMEWVTGIPLDRFADSDVDQDARDQIGQALWDFYAHQIHSLRCFHADPHPGNFLVRDGTTWVLDFGCTKEISDDFYQRQFAFLNPDLIAKPAQLEAAMVEFGLILDSDQGDQRAMLVDLGHRALTLLTRPFRDTAFDFGDRRFMEAIYDLGEENRRSGILRSVRGRRGSSDTIYLNRTYFGLYSLLSRLRARVHTGTSNFGNFSHTCELN